jgi:hypothetical protein
VREGSDDWESIQIRYHSSPQRIFDGRHDTSRAKTHPHDIAAAIELPTTPEGSANNYIMVIL